LVYQKTTLRDNKVKKGIEVCIFYKYFENSVFHFSKYTVLENGIEFYSPQVFKSYQIS